MPTSPNFRPPDVAEFQAARLVILDRDGVINEDSDRYIRTVDEWQALPGALEAIARLKQAGWRVAVATNQSGIARGFFDSATLHAMHEKMRQLLENLGVAGVDYIAWCPHGPEDGCDCRKPAAGLYRQISTHFGCSLQDVPIIGDSRRDLDAAVAVGARPILVLTGKGHRTLASGALPVGTRVFSNLAQASRSLIDG